MATTHSVHLKLKHFLYLSAGTIFKTAKKRIVLKREIAHFRQFSLLPNYFQKMCRCITGSYFSKVAYIYPRHITLPTYNKSVSLSHVQQICIPFPCTTNLQPTTLKMYSQK